MVAHCSVPTGISTATVIQVLGCKPSRCPAWSRIIHPCYRTCCNGRCCRLYVASVCSDDLPGVSPWPATCRKWFQLPWSKLKPYSEKTHPWVTHTRARTLRNRAAGAMTCSVAEAVTQSVRNHAVQPGRSSYVQGSRKPSHTPLPTLPVSLPEEFWRTCCNCSKNKGSWGWERGSMEFCVCLAVCVLLSLDIQMREQKLVWPGNKLTQVKFPDSGLFCPWQLHTKHLNCVQKTVLHEYFCVCSNSLYWLFANALSMYNLIPSATEQNCVRISGTLHPGC